MQAVWQDTRARHLPPSRALCHRKSATRQSSELDLPSSHGSAQVRYVLSSLASFGVHGDRVANHPMHGSFLGFSVYNMSDLRTKSSTFDYMRCAHSSKFATHSKSAIGQQTHSASSFKTIVRAKKQDAVQAALAQQVSVQTELTQWHCTWYELVGHALSDLRPQLHQWCCQLPPP
jgi:hypothetical protein